MPLPSLLAAPAPYDWGQRTVRPKDGKTMSDKKTPEATEENGSEEKIVLPSNEEVLEVIETPDEIDVIDVGNKESAKIIEDWPEAR